MDFAIAYTIRVTLVFLVPFSFSISWMLTKLLWVSFIQKGVDTDVREVGGGSSTPTTATGLKYTLSKSKNILN